MTKLFILSLLAGASGLAVADDAKPAPPPPPPPHHKPPQEALDACAKSAKADPCSFKIKDETRKGTCHERKHGTGLVCRGDHAPPPPPSKT
jgi:hypothetical protein